MRTRPAHLTTLWLLLAMVLTSAGFATPQRNGGRSLPGVGLRTLLGRPGGNPSAMTPQQLRIGQATTAWLTSIAVPALSAPKLIPGIGGTAYVLRLFVPATGTDELFTLYVPSSPSGQARPMIVGFHGFGVSHLDFSYYNTEFLAEAAARDWFVLAPIQINPVLNTGDISFGSAESQLNVEYVLNYVLDEWPIDLDRIYGIGFSMGGGNALSYAARHRDRKTGAFAAVVNHTGAVSPSDVWSHEPAIRTPLEATFGGPPPRFEYQRAASIDLSLTDGRLLPAGRHMAVNLTGVPVRTYYYVNDPKAYLRSQSDELDRFMSGEPSLSHELFVEMTSQPCGVTGLPGHCWDLLIESEVCDWLEMQSLAPLTAAGKVLADRDGRWNGFDVIAHGSGEFAAFDYRVLPGTTAAGMVEIFGRENIQRVTLNVDELQLDANLGLEIQTYAIDGNATEISVSGLTAPPSSVRRNNLLIANVCANGPGAARWCYDAPTGTLSLFETAGSFARWSIIP